MSGESDFRPRHRSSGAHSELPPETAIPRHFPSGSSNEVQKEEGGREKKFELR